MKALILAAGNSTRALPLTENTTKCLLKLSNKTILKHNLEQLHGLVDEVIIVIGCAGDRIKKEVKIINQSNPGLRISFAVQEKPLGTADAIAKAESTINHNETRFLVLMGDTVYFRDDIEECLKKETAIMVTKVANPEIYGVVETEKGMLRGIEEKQGNPRTNLVNAGLYVLKPEIFTKIKKLKRSTRGEFEITDVLRQMKELYVVEAKHCYLITYPWDLISVNAELLKSIKSDVLGEVEKGSVLKGEIVIGEGTVIMAGAYIEGPVLIGKNCTIGPNCYIRSSTSIGNNCRVGNAVEIKNSVLFDNVSIGHLSYVGDSVVGSNTNIGAGTITANLRHDNNNVKSLVRGKLIDTGRRKLGAIIGNDVHTGIHTSIYPGRKIFSGKTTKPGEIVKQDIR